MTTLHHYLNPTLATKHSFCSNIFNMKPSHLNLIQRALLEPQSLSETEKQEYLFLLKTDSSFKKEVEKLIMKRVAEKMKMKEQARHSTRTYTIEELLQRPLSADEAEELNQQIASYYTSNPELERATQLCEQLKNNLQLAVSRSNGNESAKHQQALSFIVQSPEKDADCTSGLLVQLSEAIDCKLIIRIMNNRNEIVQESAMDLGQTSLHIALNSGLTMGLYYCVISPMIDRPKDFALLKQYGTETRRFYIHKGYAPDLQP